MELLTSASIPRENFCEGYLTYFSTVATDLGLKLKGKLLEKSCRMTVRKKDLTPRFFYFQAIFWLPAPASSNVDFGCDISCISRLWGHSAPHIPGIL